MKMMGGERICCFLLLVFSIAAMGTKAQQIDGVMVAGNEEKDLETLAYTTAGPPPHLTFTVQTDLKKEFEKNRKEISSLKKKITQLTDSNDKLINEFQELRTEILNCKNENETLYKPKDAQNFDETLNYKNQNERLPQVCDQAAENGVYALQTFVGGLPAFGAYCVRRQGRGCIVIQRRQDGSVNFIRDWQSYKQGFGKLNGEYWLGLERIHQLTQDEDYKLWIKMISLEGQTFSGTYNEFAVGSEQDGYRLTINDFKGNFFDALKPNNGMRFSTIDNDNDLWSTGSCASKRKCAWWHNRCSDVNFNGDYKPFTQSENDGEFDNTGLWLNYASTSLSYVQLAMCPY